MGRVLRRVLEGLPTRVGKWRIRLEARQAVCRWVPTARRGWGFD